MTLWKNQKLYGPITSVSVILGINILKMVTNRFPSIIIGKIRFRTWPRDALLQHVEGDQKTWKIRRGQTRPPSNNFYGLFIS